MGKLPSGGRAQGSEHSAQILEPLSLSLHLLNCHYGPYWESEGRIMPHLMEWNTWDGPVSVGWSNKQLKKQFNKSECGTHSSVNTMPASYALWVTRPETTTQVQGQTKGTIFPFQTRRVQSWYIMSLTLSQAGAPVPTKLRQAPMPIKDKRASGLQDVTHHPTRSPASRPFFRKTSEQLSSASPAL